MNKIMGYKLYESTWKKRVRAIKKLMMKQPIETDQPYVGKYRCIVSEKFVSLPADLSNK